MKEEKTPKDRYHEARTEFVDIARKYNEVKYKKAQAELEYWIWLEEKREGTSTKKKDK